MKVSSILLALLFALLTNAQTGYYELKEFSSFDLDWNEQCANDFIGDDKCYHWQDMTFSGVNDFFEAEYFKNSGPETDSSGVWLLSGSRMTIDLPITEDVNHVIEMTLGLAHGNHQWTSYYTLRDAKGHIIFEGGLRDSAHGTAEGGQYGPHGMASCCTEWNAECYTHESAENYFHACYECEGDPCYDECTDDWGHETEYHEYGNNFNASSAECAGCCQNINHETNWNCQNEDYHYGGEEDDGWTASGFQTSSYPIVFATEGFDVTTLTLSCNEPGNRFVQDYGRQISQGPCWVDGLLGYFVIDEICPNTGVLYKDFRPDHGNLINPENVIDDQFQTVLSNAVFYLEDNYVEGDIDVQQEPLPVFWINNAGWLHSKFESDFSSTYEPRRREMLGFSEGERANMLYLFYVDLVDVFEKFDQPVMELGIWCDHGCMQVVGVPIIPGDHDDDQHGFFEHDHADPNAGEYFGEYQYFMEEPVFFHGMGYDQSEMNSHAMQFALHKAFWEAYDSKLAVHAFNSNILPFIKFFDGHGDYPRSAIVELKYENAHRIADPDQFVLTHRLYTNTEESDIWSVVGKDLSAWSANFMSGSDVFGFTYDANWYFESFL